MSLRKTGITLLCAMSAFSSFIPQALATGLSVPITNPGAETNTFSGWTTSATDEDWSILSSGTHGGTKAFQTGNKSSSMYQYIDLIDLGYTEEQIRSYDYFEFSAWIKKTDDSPETNDLYYMGLAERGWGLGAIATTGTPPSTTAPTDWEKVTLGLGNYGADLRYIHIEVGGYDETEGAGKKGPAFDDMTLTMYGDRAAPVVISLSPADNATSIAPTSTLGMQFDQTVYTGTGNIEIHRLDNDSAVATIDITSDSVTGFGTQTLSITPGVILTKNTNYYITIDNSAILDAWGNAYTGISTSSAWNVKTKQSGNASEQTPHDYSISNLASSVNSAGEATLTWSTGSDVTLVKISAEIAGEIEKDISGIVPATTAWTWKIPEEYQGKEIIFTVAATDLATTLASATTPAIIWNTTQSAETPEKDTTSYTSGIFVKTPDAQTVYFIDAANYRHPVPDTQTFFTWENSFNAIQTISQENLAQMPLGTPLLPKPGTVLVKIESLPKVFAIEGTAEEPTFRWITSESLATDLYGSAWADYVIDIPPTLWSHLTFGTNITLINEGENTDNLLRREDLN